MSVAYILALLKSILSLRIKNIVKFECQCGTRSVVSTIYICRRKDM